MKIYKIVFSPTGGTEKAADQLVSGLKRAAEIMEEVTEQAAESAAVDLSDPMTDFDSLIFSPEDICVVAVPSFGGRVPGTAVSRIRQMKGRKARAVLVVVYGNRAYEDTMVELRDTLIDAGFRCMAAVAAVAEHSIMHQFAAGRPDETDCAELTAFAEKIWKKLRQEDNCKNTDRENAEVSVKLEIPGNYPYRKYGVIPMKPTADSRCTACGLCAKRCPVGAIPPDNLTETNKELCISCMRCVSICPQKSRHINKLLLAAAEQKLKKACSGRKNNEFFVLS